MVLDFLRDQPIPAALGEASEFLSTWRAERIAANPPPPAVLYHYTNVVALMNIFRSKELWATNAAYTNDQTEILHSLLQLRQIVEAHLIDRPNDPAGDSMLRVADEFYTIVAAYVVCFCADGDLLSQWSYGRAGGCLHVRPSLATQRDAGRVTNCICVDLEMSVKLVGQPGLAEIADS